MVQDTDLVVDRETRLVMTGANSPEPLALVIDEDGNKVELDGLGVAVTSQGESLKTREGQVDQIENIDGEIKSITSLVNFHVYQDNYRDYGRGANNIISGIDNGDLADVITESGKNILSDRDRV